MDIIWIKCLRLHITSLNEKATRIIVIQNVNAYISIQTFFCTYLTYIYLRHI